MYKAFNDNVIVITETDPNLQNQVLEAEVVSTTENTKTLQGMTIAAERRSYTQLAEIEGAKTQSGIILGNKKIYASLNIKDIIAVKDNK